MQRDNGVIDCTRANACDLEILLRAQSASIPRLRRGEPCCSRGSDREGGRDRRLDWARARLGSLRPRLCSPQLPRCFGRTGAARRSSTPARSRKRTWVRRRPSTAGQRPLTRERSGGPGFRSTSARTQRSSFDAFGSPRVRKHANNPSSGARTRLDGGKLVYIKSNSDSALGSFPLESWAGAPTPS
jgi:hypothetical protein